MQKLVVIALGVAIGWLSYGVGHVHAQGLPPGVHVEVLAEYPSAEPGIEKIVVKKFTLEPGAKLENFTPQYANL